MAAIFMEARKTTRMRRRSTPDAKLYRRAARREARLAYLGHLVIQNRHGLIVDALATPTDGNAERNATVALRAYTSN